MKQRDWAWCGMGVVLAVLLGVRGASGGVPAADREGYLRDVVRILGAKRDDSDDPPNRQARQIRELAGEYHVGLVDRLEAFKGSVAAGGKFEGLMAQSNHPNGKRLELVARGLMGWFGGDG